MKGILFIQRRPSRAGAQVAIARTLKHLLSDDLKPAILTSSEGWLTQECLNHKITCLVAQFPSSRSWWARLWGNGFFAQKIRGTLENFEIPAHLVVGNDYTEGILTNLIAQTLRLRSAIILRSSEMKREDFFKYQCHQCDLIYTVGNDLYQKTLSWGVPSKVKLLYDGLEEEDFFAPKAKAAEFPKKILVVGSELHYKGWQDFAQAVDELEKDPEFPSIEFDLTGKPPDPLLNDMQLNRPRRCSFHFIGRIEKFKELIRSYDLVIHPSRQEAFGLAMVEVLAAGIPLLASRVGIIEEVQKDARFLFEAHDAQDQARKIRHIWESWKEIDFHLETCQNNLRESFLLNRIVEDMKNEFLKLMK